MISFSKQAWPIKYDKKPLMVLLNGIAELVKHWVRTAAVTRVLTTAQIAFAYDVTSMLAKRFESRRLAVGFNSARFTLIAAAVYASLEYCKKKRRKLVCFFNNWYFCFNSCCITDFNSIYGFLFSIFFDLTHYGSKKDQNFSFFLFRSIHEIFQWFEKQHKLQSSMFRQQSLIM